MFCCDRRSLSTGSRSCFTALRRRWSSAVSSGSGDGTAPPQCLWTIDSTRCAKFPTKVCQVRSSATRADRRSSSPMSLARSLLILLQKDSCEKSPSLPNTISAAR